MQGEIEMNTGKLGNSNVGGGDDAGGGGGGVIRLAQNLVMN